MNSASATIRTTVAPDCFNAPASPFIEELPPLPELEPPELESPEPVFDGSLALVDPLACSAFPYALQSAFGDVGQSF